MADVRPLAKHWWGHDRLSAVLGSDVTDDVTVRRPTQGFVPLWPSPRATSTSAHTARSCRTSSSLQRDQARFPTTRRQQPIRLVSRGRHRWCGALVGPQAGSSFPYLPGPRGKVAIRPNGGAFRAIPWSQHQTPPVRASCACYRKPFSGVRNRYYLIAMHDRSVPGSRAGLRLSARPSYSCQRSLDRSAGAWVRVSSLPADPAGGRPTRPPGWRFTHLSGSRRCEWGTRPGVPRAG